MGVDANGAEAAGEVRRTPATAGLIARYREWLPVEPDGPVVSLGEGSTPLVHAPVLSDLVHGEVWIKVEGANPTGSFKDRGMTVAVSRAAAEGARAVVCASTGNTSASAAAYACRAGMRPVVLLPAGRIARGKLAQAIVHGAEIVQVDGNFDDCLTVARKLAEVYPVALVNSVNPDRIEGQKTAAFEVVDVLGDAPDLHLLPVGNAGNVSAYWRGYRQYAEAGLSTRRPRMWGFQAAGAAPLVLGHPVLEPETVATAIRIGNPASADLANAAREESGGRFESVTDEQILDAQAFLAAREGIFVEPASASGVAGLMALHAAGEVGRGLTIVVTVTGNGLKDIDTALSRHTVAATTVEPDVHQVAEACGLTR
ncbi:threonine synthase [Auraticoccus sp. F435]|uniref:Threonine synthase n=1 Tax=Auraticoccus cholistanensis TaxID=2656650 RepID=A0A6A9V0W4_9ACTN|nr:threonine synthase [Auraticoccus cholistanensis]MVA76060.1 threonine synthase [Auraticoccus cholistanensis]